MFFFFSHHLCESVVLLVQQQETGTQQERRTERNVCVCVSECVGCFLAVPCFEFKDLNVKEAKTNDEPVT